ncbi:Ku protein [Occultella glacieicola]|uniref:Non-homologous end joining protein Ku n=1 Tax=Occultella glacieicola TaxID=2518684 RepID=A0ABY2E248_9MICO|nr:Ku protein [Occultella glacieicola]TDE89639.1 Ku protein [Occultella glacieicola]
MRSIWKGAITFGLVNVPVSVYSATESHDVKLHQVHDADGGRIRYQRKCEVCGEVVPYEHIDKAYTDGEQTVVLTDDDLQTLPAERSREIDVLEFVPSEQVEPIMLESSYYLAPTSASTKSYVLLRRTLEESERTAIVSFTLRQKTRLAALRVRGDVLLLQTLLWSDEVREADFPALADDVKISAKELQMSAALVSSYESDFAPGEFTDDYQAQMKRLIEAKLEKGEAFENEAPEEAEEGGEVLDLMEALRRSVEASRAKRDTASTTAEADDDGGSPASKPSSSRAKSTSTSGAAKTSKSAASKSGTAKDTKSKTAKAEADDEAEEAKPTRRRTKKSA